MPVFALYNFDDKCYVAADSATADGAQNGGYFNGAFSRHGKAYLDGCNDKIKIYPDSAFQLPAGTLEIQFALQSPVGNSPDTVLSRDSSGQTAGGFRIEVLKNGSVLISHESAGGTTTFQTAACFVNTCDQIKVVYSWDAANGGAVQIDNLTTLAHFEADVPAGLTMDQGSDNQPWLIGAGQSHSAAGSGRNLDNYFNGSVEYFSVSNTVDNDDEDPTANPDAAETPEDVVVTIDVLANDTDPNGDPLSILGTPVADHGTVSVNPDGTLRYTPNANFNGTDTITYTVTDPDGNESSSIVTVTVTPVNDAPVAVDDAANTNVNTPIVIPVLANDTDVDGDALAILGTPTSADGTVVVNSDGTISFTPNAGFTGEAVIAYTVTDPDGLTDDAVVRVQVGNTTGRDGVVRGTDDADRIDTSYVDPFDGDRIDAGDAILPGAAPNDDVVVAGAGNDTIIAGLGDDDVFGGAGNDSILGGIGDDTLRGEAGNDRIFGGDGSDLVDGGIGNDYIDTRGSTEPLPDRGYPGLYPADTDPFNDRDTVLGGAGNDTIFTGDDADFIYGEAGNDLIDAGVDDDTVFGGTGSDTITGGEGSDLLEGGDGGDLIFGGLGPGFPDAINIPDAAGDLRPDNGRDTIYGGAGNDTIYAEDDNDLVFGGAGDDLIDGGVDQDYLFGDEGNDTIIGGEGADRLYGGDDRDVFVVTTQANGLNDLIDGNEGGDDFDTLDLRGAGPIRIDYDPANAENGIVNFLDSSGNATGTLSFFNIENVIPCFTPGTRIATPRGEVAVEDLRPGDRVITRDNGIQEIRWAGKKALSWSEMNASPHLRPILIRQGSLGNDLPERDMIVSPNHRLLVANDRTALYFDEHEVLVAAKHLINNKSVYEVQSLGTSYIHFMFDQHEVVLSNGAWTESFQPGDYSLNGMGNAQRNEIYELFPELKTKAGLENYMAARRTLKKHEARLLAK